MAFPTIPNHIWEENMRYFRELREELEVKSDEELKGEMSFYESTTSPLWRRLGSMFATKPHNRYSTASWELEKRDIRRLSIEELENITNEKLGFFSSFRASDRQNYARELLKKKGSSL